MVNEQTAKTCKTTSSLAVLGLPGFADLPQLRPPADHRQMPRRAQIAPVLIPESEQSEQSERSEASLVTADLQPPSDIPEESTHCIDAWPSNRIGVDSWSNPTSSNHINC